MEQLEWGPRLVRVIARQIRRHRERKRPKMSAQALATRCAQLGWPIKRSVLSNLESGYRETITVPELFVIAAALEVPPSDLIAPLGRVDEVEILPGMSATPEAVADWLAGHQALPGTRWASNPSALFASHAQYLEAWKHARLRVRVDLSNGDHERAAANERAADGYLAALLRVRDAMRGEGVSPPQLPAELEAVEGPGRFRREALISPGRAA